MLRQLRSFGVCQILLRTFYDIVVANVLCCGLLVSVKDKNRLDKLIRNSSSVIGCSLPSVDEIVQTRMVGKLSYIMKCISHPIHDSVQAMCSSFSNRFIYPCCSKERYRRYFLPTAVRLFN